MLKRSGVALALWGEPGVGKSHAVQQVLRETACHSYSFHALTPVASLVRDLPRPSGKKALPAWAEPVLEQLKNGEAIEAKKTADAMGALLAGLAPVVLCLEDIHEANPEGLTLIVALAEMATRTKGVALLASSRTPPPQPFEGYRLEPLDPQGSKALLEGEIGASLPEEALEWVYAQALGNPLFSLEYVRYLARQGYLWNDGRRWRWREPPSGLMPVTVEALIERLLHDSTWDTAWSKSSSQVLAARAILPLDIAQSCWAEVAEVSADELAQAQRNLEEQGILRAGHFSHPLYREVIVRGLSGAERQRLARKALHTLAQENPRAAAQFVADAGLAQEEALAWLGGAAELEKSLGNDLQAAQLTARAAGYAQGRQQGQMALEAAQVLQYHDLPTAIRLTQLALQTPAATPDLVRFHAHLLARQGQVPDIPSLLAGLPTELREQVDPASLLISTSHIAGHNQQAFQTWLAHPELHARPSAELLRAVAASALATGQMEPAKALSAQGLEQALEPSLRAEFLSIQALIAYHQGDYPAAEATIKAVLDLLEGLGAPRLRSTALVNRAAFLRMLGRYGEMRECLEEALAIRQRAGDAKAYAFAQAALVEVLIEQGDYERAEEAVSEAIQTLELYGPSRFLTNAHSMASLLYLSQDTPLSGLLALKHAEQALRYARQIGSVRVVREILFDASLANTRAGYWGRGLELAEEAHGLAEAAGNSPHDNVRTLWARGVALAASGNLKAAEAVLEQALELARPLHIPLDEEKLGLELDRLRGHLEQARARLAWFLERGLLNGANLVWRYFPQLKGSPAVSGSKTLPPGATRHPPPATRLEVLGPMQITQQGKSEPLRGQKRKELLALLLEARIAGRAEASTLELIEALYPGIPDQEAGDALKQTVFKARASLGQSLISTTASGYALGELESDAELFLQSGDTRLWRGVYLQDAAVREEAASDALYQALANKAASLLESDPREAARLGRILLEADPYSLEALRLSLQALHRSQNHKSLKRLYEEARARMLEVGERLPQSWQEFLTPVTSG